MRMDLIQGALFLVGVSIVAMSIGAWHLCQGISRWRRAAPFVLVAYAGVGVAAVLVRVALP
jgi:hypothetical protein